MTSLPTILSIILLATGAVFGASAAYVHQNGLNTTVQNVETAFQSETEKPATVNKNRSEPNSTNFFRSEEIVHEHAQFHVIINGSSFDFTQRRFQLQARYVHLENGKSSIVHKHRDNVRWRDFLESIDVEIFQNTSETCVNITGELSCGKGEIELVDGKNISSEIVQGQHLIIAIGKNHSQMIEEYRKYQLPAPYLPEKQQGRKL